MNQLLKTGLISLFLLLSISTSAFSKDNNIRSYKDRGIKYYPRYVKRGTIKYAKASWYGKPFHGRLTANGERYNMYAMTAAHRTYAMGTVLKVTSLKNWRSVIVRVNDRGPFYHSRAIDLSYAAAKKLGFVKKGVEKIKIEVLSSKSKSFNKKYISSQQNKKINTKKSKFLRKHKVQLASFYDKELAYSFKKKHQLKNTIIVKKYINAQKKHTYKVIVKCTPWEANKLLKSKKFIGAYKV